MVDRELPNRFEILTPDVLNQNKQYGGWLKRAMRDAIAHGADPREMGHATPVIDWVRKEIRFVRNPNQVILNGEQGLTEENHVGASRKWDAVASRVKGTTPVAFDPSQVDMTRLGRSPASQKVLEGLDGALHERVVRSRREATELLDELGVAKASLSRAEKHQVLAGVYARSATDPSIHLEAWEDALLTDKELRAVRTNPASFYGQFFGEPTEAMKKALRARGIRADSRHDVFGGLAREARAHKEDQDADIAHDYHEAKKADASTYAQLVRRGIIGEKTAQKMQQRGWSLADLHTGRISEDQLRELGGVGEEKVAALRRAGFNIAPSAAPKRPVGRPRKIFGPGRNPFRAENQRASLLGGTIVTQSPTTGNLETRHQPGRLALALARFTESFQATIGRPFGLVQKYRNTEARRAERDAIQLAKTKRAVAFRERVARSRSGFGATLAEVGFFGTKAVRTVLVLALSTVTLLLFLPVGIFQYGAWLVFGLAAFVLNGAYLVGLTMVNFAASSGMTSLNTLGFATQNFFQGFLDQIPLVLPTSAPHGVLPAFNPVDPSGLFHFASVLDPNLFFPDCVNTNSLGAALLGFLSMGLTSFSGWIAQNAGFALGVCIVLFLGVPAYFVSRGTSIGFTITGVALALLPPVPGARLPMAFVFLVAVVLVVGAIWALRWLSQAGVFTIVLSAGLAIGLVLAYLVVYHWATDATVGSLFDLNTTLQVDISALGGALSGTTLHLAQACQLLGGLVTTGWAHALDPARLDPLRNMLNLGDAATLAQEAQRRCGGA